MRTNDRWRLSESASSSKAHPAGTDDDGGKIFSSRGLHLIYKFHGHVIQQEAPVA